MRAAVDTFCQREDRTVAGALVAYRPQFVAVEEPQCALKAEFAGHKVRVVYDFGASDVVGEGLVVVLGFLVFVSLC